MVDWEELARCVLRHTAEAKKTWDTKAASSADTSAR